MWLCLVAVLAGVVVVAATSDVTVESLLQDATTVAGVPFYVGSISLLGLLLWAMATGICAFVAILLRGDDADSGRWRRSVVATGMLTGLLLFDDAFLVHDAILPRYLGVEGKAYAAFYAVAFGAYVVGVRDRLRRTNPFLLSSALALFAASYAVEALREPLSGRLAGSVMTLAEEGAKLLGIGGWVAWCGALCRDALTRGEPAATARPDSATGSPRR